MSWQLSKLFRFEASHQLVGHDGKCARLHGHSWVARVTCESEVLQEAGPKAGMVIDYGDVSSAVKPIIEEFLDHHHLNATLGMERPTSELVAKWLWGKLKPAFGDLLTCVEIEETCTSRCAYREDRP